MFFLIFKNETQGYLNAISCEKVTLFENVDDVDKTIETLEGFGLTNNLGDLKSKSCQCLPSSCLHCLRSVFPCELMRVGQLPSDA